jgi:hypothetical protein
LVVLQAGFGKVAPVPADAAGSAILVVTNGQVIIETA